jgi:large subunit ribosomal protein L18
MRSVKEKTWRRTRAHQRLRQRVAGNAARPRLAVFKSLRYVYAQLIDDATGRTLAQANSREAEVSSHLKGATAGKQAARLVGEVMAERAKAQGVTRVVFDRGGYIYHGKIKEVAEGARAKGLEF